MRYLKIQLKGYKFLSLNNISLITITPESKFHWILGSNGSGKSSLQREISPLAANHTHYTAEGYKYVKIEKDGDIYDLKSVFGGPKRLYSFVKNGVELNDGHTSTVFNNLVLQHFGITKEIHEFSLGLRKFTQMSPVDKKNWITKLSDVDYTYALKYFQKLSSAYRDVVGSIKTDHERLLEAKAKMVGVETVNLLKSELELLKQKSLFLIEVTPNPRDPRDLNTEKKRKIENTFIEIDKFFKQVMSKNKQFLPLPDKDLLTNEIASLESQVNSMLVTSETIFKEFETVSSELSNYLKVQNLNYKELTESVVAKADQVETLKNELTYNFTSQCKTAKSLFHTWLSELDLIVSHLVADPEGILTGDNYSALKTEIEKNQEFHRVLGDNLSKARIDLQALTSHNHSDKIVCPICTHEWIPGKNETDIIKLNNFIEHTQKTTDEVSEKLNKLYKELERFENFKKGLQYLNDFIWKYEAFKPFWEVIKASSIHTKNPESISSLAYHFQTAIDTMIVIMDLEESIKVDNNNLSILKSTNLTSVKMLEDRKETLEKQLNSLYETRNELMERLKVLKAKAQFRSTLEKIQSDVIHFQKLWVETAKTDFDYKSRELLGQLLIETNTTIMQHEKTIRTAELQNSQIEMLEENLAKSTELAKAYKAAVDELSPTKGLIAKGLTGFINHFVKMVNSIIEKVWLYPMSLTPILPNEEDDINLDYKFKVSVKGEEVPDISECSTGQKEIIDLAIKVVALAFLRLDRGPLFLDEFGANMDVAHKAAAFKMISELLSQSNFSQIYMISHFESSFNSNLDADITVLCPANIQIPNGLEFNNATSIIN